jgi:hypothetical protein
MKFADLSRAGVKGAALAALLVALLLPIRSPAGYEPDFERLCGTGFGRAVQEDAEYVKELLLKAAADGVNVFALSSEHPGLDEILEDWVFMMRLIEAGKYHPENSRSLNDLRDPFACPLTPEKAPPLPGQIAGAAAKELLATAEESLNGLLAAVSSKDTVKASALFAEFREAVSKAPDVYDDDIREAVLGLNAEFEEKISTEALARLYAADAAALTVKAEGALDSGDYKRAKSLAGELAGTAGRMEALHKGLAKTAELVREKAAAIEERAAAAEKVASLGLVIKGFLLTPSERFALISGGYYAEGERVLTGLKIKKITPPFVLLDFSGTEVTIRETPDAF